jgi:hypothetical protein
MLFVQNVNNIHLVYIEGSSIQNGTCVLMAHNLVSQLQSMYCQAYQVVCSTASHLRWHTLVLSVINKNMLLLLHQIM